MLTLQEVSDRLEIQQLMAVYSNAIDQRNFDRLAEVFTPDAYIDYRAMGGIAGHYDAFALHPYEGPFAPDATSDTYRSFKLAVEQTTQLMATYGDSQKPIWITEMGWSTNDVSDWTRAAYLARAVSMVRAR